VRSLRHGPRETAEREHQHDELTLRHIGILKHTRSSQHRGMILLPNGR
jgi:hypothetical protein